MAAASSVQFEWLSGREAVLRRPDAYVGGLDAVEEDCVILNEDGSTATIRTNMSPILMKIVEEVVVNAIDSATRDALVRNVRVSFDKETGCFQVENDGGGIPIAEFQGTGRLIPSVVFSELHAGSNFKDSEKRLTGGRNGVGVSCTNVWSTVFEVEVRDMHKRFSQRFEENLSVCGDPKVEDAPRDRQGLVRVRFVPDYERLQIGLSANADSIEKLTRTRCMEASICVRAGVIVSFQGQKLCNKPCEMLKQLCGCDAMCVEEFGEPGGAGCTLVLGRLSLIHI